MGPNKKSFWNSLPGVLTGVAAIITALAGLYIAIRSGDRPAEDPQRLPSIPSGERSAPAYTEWPLVAEETFTHNPFHWWTGSYPTVNLKRFELGMVGGKYRWDLEIIERTEYPIYAPFGAATDFYLAVDMRFVATSATNAQAGLFFGSASGKDYGFRITPSNFFELSFFDGTKNVEVFDWTPVSINADASNRIAVLVDNQKIQLYVNSVLVANYMDRSFTGGKVGLLVGGEAGTSVVVDFDNFEFRRKP